MTTPREALEHIEISVRHKDEILTALAPHLRTPGTIEVCAKCKSPQQSKFFAAEYHWSWSDCRQQNCPIRKATP